MEIKANQWYRTRGGEIAYVAAIVPFPHMYPGVGIADDNPRTWTLDGTYDIDATREYDIVEHLPDCDSFDWVPKPKIQLEVGKKYVLTNGEVIGPMIGSISYGDPKDFHWKYQSPGKNLRYWNEDGLRFFPCDRPHENIVAEYIAPEPVYEPWDFDSMPYIVRVKENECGTRWIARPASDRYCMRGTFSSTYKELFDHYTQLDGTPCGRIKS